MLMQPQAMVPMGFDPNAYYMPGIWVFRELGTGNFGRLSFFWGLTIRKENPGDFALFFFCFFFGGGGKGGVLFFFPSSMFFSGKYFFRFH